MRSCTPRGLLTISTAACLLLASLPTGAAVPTGRKGGELNKRATGETAASVDAREPASGARSYVLFDGSTATLGADGFGSRRDVRGGVRPVFVERPRGHSAMGGGWGPDDRSIIRRLSIPDRGRYVPGEVIVVLESGVARSLAGTAGTSKQALMTGDPAVDATLRDAGAVGARPLAPSLLSGPVGGGRARALARGDLSHAWVVRLKGVDARVAARRLRDAPGVLYASPNWTVSSMAGEPRPKRKRCGASSGGYGCGIKTSLPPRRYPSSLAAGLAKYVRMIPAPARAIDVRLSIMARS